MLNIPLARRNVSLRRVKSKAPALQQEQTEQNGIDVKMECRNRNGFIGKSGDLLLRRRKQELPPSGGASLSDYDTRPGFDRDEWPMALFSEGGAGADVRYINPSDNRGAGSAIGNALRNYPDGTVVKFVIVK